MRGVDLETFDFDYDLTWMAFFLAPDGRVLGRYGGRSPQSAEDRLSLAGLRTAMERALAACKRNPLPTAPAPAGTVRRADDFPAAKRSPQSCIHCHQVYDFRREYLQAQGRWSLDEVWVYPLPENVGLGLDRHRSHRVASVAPGSPAARTGLHPSDELVLVNRVPVLSFADVQYGLHRAPARGRIPIVWQRDGRTHQGELELAEGWRKTDVSWRWSLRGLDPTPWVRGLDLTAEEKRALGLGPKRLALRQGPFVPGPVAAAGIRQNDVIVGLDGQPLEMTARQFQAYVRLHHKVGDRIVFNVLRDGRPVDVPFTLIARPRSP
jgi:serine protease Do